jgi:hypothetical protein
MPGMISVPLKWENGLPLDLLIFSSHSFSSGNFGSNLPRSGARNLSHMAPGDAVGPSLLPHTC